MLPIFLEVIFWNKTLFNPSRPALVQLLNELWQIAKSANHSLHMKDFQ